MRPESCPTYWTEGDKAFGCVLPKGHDGECSACAINKSSRSTPAKRGEVSIPDTPAAPPSQEGIPACEVIEPFDVAPPQTLLEWMRERHANCLRLASQKSGEDKLGWLEDAEYFRQAIERLAGSSFISDSPRNSAASTKLFLKLVAVAHSLGISTWEAQERLSIDALREAARASAPLPAETPKEDK